MHTLKSADFPSCADLNDRCQQLAADAACTQTTCVKFEQGIQFCFFHPGFGAAGGTDMSVTRGRYGVVVRELLFQDGVTLYTLSCGSDWILGGLVLHCATVRYSRKKVCGQCVHACFYRPCLTCCNVAMNIDVYQACQMKATSEMGQTL